MELTALRDIDYTVPQIVYLNWRGYQAFILY